MAIFQSADDKAWVSFLARLFSKKKRRGIVIALESAAVVVAAACENFAIF